MSKVNEDRRLVRKYEERDLEDILFAWEEASRIAHPFLSAEFLQEERYKIPHVFLPSTETWVVEQGRRVIGFISLMGNEVGGLFVLPQFHGSGAGRALMDKAKELYGDLEVEVFKDNPLGRNFYEKCGFVIMNEKVHQQTGFMLLRLKFSANRRIISAH